MIEQELDPNAPHSADTGIGGFFRRAWNGLFGGGGGNRGIGGWWTPDRMSHAVDRLMKEGGLTQEGAAGLVARWSAIEAGGGPTSENSIGAFGIGQWLDRKPALMRYMAENKLDPKDFDAQLSFAIQELKGSEWRAAHILRNASSAAEGARGASAYERAEGYSSWSGTDNFTGSTPVDKVLKAIANKTSASPPSRPVTGISIPPSGAAPNTWGQGQIWNGLNDALPVGPPGGNTSKIVNSTINNTVNVTGSDPQSTAAMVGVHLDRTSNDIARNLQGAHQ